MYFGNLVYCDLLGLHEVVVESKYSVTGSLQLQTLDVHLREYKHMSSVVQPFPCVTPIKQDGILC